VQTCETRCSREAFEHQILLEECNQSFLCGTVMASSVNATTQVRDVQMKEQKGHPFPSPSSKIILNHAISFPSHIE
jgi:hypothetical protein